MLASADGAALASVGGDGDAFADGGAVFATTGVAFFTTGLAAFGRATGFAGSLPQKLNRDDSGAVSLTPPAYFCSTLTFAPTFAIEARCTTCSFVKRKQPDEFARPTVRSLLVPWMR